MNPNQYQFEQQPQQNPYDFILQGGGQQQNYKAPGSANGVGKRILIVLAGFTLLFIIGIVAMTLLSGNQKNVSDQLYSIAARQAEIIRVAESGRDKVRSTELKTIVGTTVAVLPSDQKKALALIEKELTAADKNAAARLKAYQSTQTDETLASAERSNEYDAAFIDVLIALYTQYANELKTTSANLNQSTYTKELATFYTNATTLGTQLQALQQ